MIDKNINKNHNVTINKSYTQMSKIVELINYNKLNIKNKLSKILPYKKRVIQVYKNKILYLKNTKSNIIEKDKNKILRCHIKKIIYKVFIKRFRYD